VQSYPKVANGQAHLPNGDDMHCAKNLYDVNDDAVEL
jgi:hypothetical protein